MNPLRIKRQICTFYSAFRQSGISGAVHCFAYFLEGLGLTRACEFIRHVLLETKWLRFRLGARTNAIVFVTFADGEIYKSERLCSEVVKTGVFTKIITKDKKMLGPDYEMRFSAHLKFPRGYGYWSWKPYIIDQQLSRMRDGDVLFYADSGCSIHGGPRALKALILNFVGSSANILVANATPGQKIGIWTKRDLLEMLGKSNLPQIRELPQYEAGRLALKACNETRNFIQLWLEIAQDLHMIDDSPSLLPEHAEFIEHRHDQSIFSTLLYDHDFVTGLEVPIHASRLKS